MGSLIILRINLEFGLKKGFLPGGAIDFMAGVGAKKKKKKNHQLSFECLLPTPSHSVTVISINQTS